MANVGDEINDDDLFQAALECACKRRLISKKLKQTIRIDHCRSTEHSYVLADEQGHVVARVLRADALRFVASRDPLGRGQTNPDHLGASSQELAEGISHQARWVRAHSSAGLWTGIAVSIAMLGIPAILGIIARIIPMLMTSLHLYLANVGSLIIGLSICNILPTWLVFRRCPEIAKGLAGNSSRYHLWIWIDVAGLYMLVAGEIIIFVAPIFFRPRSAIVFWLSPMIFMLLGALIGSLQASAGLQHSLRRRWIFATGLSYGAGSLLPMLFLPLLFSLSFATTAGQRLAFLQGELLFILVVYVVFLIVPIWLFWRLRGELTGRLVVRRLALSPSATHSPTSG